MDVEGNEGQSLLLHRADQPANLASVEQQLPAAAGVVIHVAARLVGGDRETIEPHLAVVHHPVRLLEADLTGADGLDLRPGEHQSRLPRLENVVVVPRSGIAGQRRAARGGRRLVGRHGLTPN